MHLLLIYNIFVFITTNITLLSNIVIRQPKVYIVKYYLTVMHFNNSYNIHICMIQYLINNIIFLR